MSFQWSRFLNNRWGIPPIPNPVTGGGRAQATAGGPAAPVPPAWQALSALAREVSAEVKTRGGWSTSLGFELALFSGQAPGTRHLDAPHAPGGVTPDSPGVAPLMDAYRQVPSTRFNLWVNGPAGGDRKHPRGSRWTFVGTLRVDEIQNIKAHKLTAIAIDAAGKRVP